MTDFVWNRDTETLYDFCERVAGPNGPWITLELNVPTPFARFHKWPLQAVQRDHIGELMYTSYNVNPNSAEAVDCYKIRSSPNFAMKLIEGLVEQGLADDKFKEAMRQAIAQQLESKTWKDA